MTAVDLLLPEHRDSVGESPLWSVVEQALYWVDIEGFALNRWSYSDAQHHRWAMPERPACIALHARGGLVVAMETGVFHLRFEGPNKFDLVKMATVQHPQAGMRFNDGRCDRQGRFWAGTMVRDMGLAAASGSIYRLDNSGLSVVLEAGWITPNGMAFSPDGTMMYLSDSHPQIQKIWTLALHDDGSVSNKKLFVDFKPLPGRPDGAAIDEEGAYWICANDAGMVHRFLPDGRLERSLKVPVSKPSMCSFGGPALDQLFITTIKPANPQGDDLTLAGAVFVARPDVRGLAEHAFINPI